MPQRTKEEIKEYKRQYYQKNKEKLKQKRREYRNKNKEKQNQQMKEYNIKNKEKIKEHRETETYKKSQRIYQWKKRGILCFDWDLLNDIFLKTTHCEFCNCELTTDRYPQSTTRCLDHDHNITDKFNIRGVLCNSCNVKDVLK